jgi:hypothetical protein
MKQNFGRPAMYPLLSWQDRMLVNKVASVSLYRRRQQLIGRAIKPAVRANRLVVR